jgi:hypothetical protein
LKRLPTLQRSSTVGPTTTEVLIVADDTGTDWAALADRLDELATDRRWDCWNMHGDGRRIVPEGYDPLPDCCDAADGAYSLRAAAVGLRRLAQLDTAIGQQVAELRAIHHPQWASPDGGYTTERRDGYTPVGCAECYPHDGSWPCVTAMVADDLAAVLGSGEQPESCRPRLPVRPSPQHLHRLVSLTPPPATPELLPHFHPDPL